MTNTGNKLTKGYYHIKSVGRVFPRFDFGYFSNLLRNKCRNKINLRFKQVYATTHEE